MDPLDRKLPGDDPDDDEKKEDQALKVADLKKEILELSTIEGDKLNAPLSPVLMSKLNRLFANEMKRCSNIVKKYVEDAKKDEKFDKIIRNEPIIQEYIVSLRFFVDNDLLYDAEDRLDSFKKYIEQAQKMIENAK